MTFSIIQLFLYAVADEMISFTTARKNFHLIWHSFLALLRFLLLPSLVFLCFFLLLRFRAGEQDDFELVRYVVYVILGHFLEEIEEYEEGQFFLFVCAAFLITLLIVNIIVAVMTD